VCVNALVAPGPDFWFQARATHRERSIAMLWTIFVILLVLWLLGFSLHIAGGLIHILLVIALIVLVVNLVSGRRGVL
jgi:hypothetical protein